MGAAWLRRAGAIPSPNCHGQIHHGTDGKDLNKKIEIGLDEIEKE